MRTDYREYQSDSSNDDDTYPARRISNGSSAAVYANQLLETMYTFDDESDDESVPSLGF